MSPPGCVSRTALLLLVAASGLTVRLAASGSGNYELAKFVTHQREAFAFGVQPYELAAFGSAGSDEANTSSPAPWLLTEAEARDPRRTCPSWVEWYGENYTTDALLLWSRRRMPHTHTHTFSLTWCHFRSPL